MRPTYQSSTYAFVVKSTLFFWLSLFDLFRAV